MAYRKRTFEIGPDDAGRRLDRILRSLLASVPLSMIYRLFRDGAVRVSGKRVDGAHRTVAGETIEVRLADSPNNKVSPSRRPPGESSRPAAAFFAGLVIVETPDLAIVNKPRGVLSHGPGGIDEAAIAYYADRMAMSLAFTPAPLHRLDRNTSGALAVSASLLGATTFSQALRSGLVEKSYIALLGGDLIAEEQWVDDMTRDDESKISSVMAPVTGAACQGQLLQENMVRRAKARAIPLLRGNGMTLALIRLGTGRTHQIRAQAAAHGYALAGDTKYGGQHRSGGYILHCAILAMPPGVGKPEGLRVEAALPLAAEQTLARLFGEDWKQRIPPIA